MADINQQFQQILGRAPTGAESEYFQKFLNEGSIQAHEVGQILQSIPEFQQARLEKDTAAYGQKLQAGDEQIMQQGANIAGAQATSRFAGLGRPNSSALAASVFGQQGQLAGNLAQSRQSALASFYGQGLQNNAAMYQQGGQSALERGYGMRDETRQFNQQMQLARYNADNYNNYLAQANKKARNGAMGSMLGAGLGLAAGAALAAPTGGMSMGAGAALGGGFGSNFGGAAGGLF